MPNFKVPNNPHPHFLSEADIDAGGVSMLPIGAQQITDDEASAMLSALIPTPTAAELVRQQIISLESQTTPRRIREAVLGIDGGWLLNINNEINFLRNKLKGLS